MVSVLALTFGVVVLVVACISLAIRWDFFLFVIRPKFSLRALLVALAIGPIVLALAIFFLTLHGFIPGFGVTSNGEVKLLPR